MIEVGGIAYAYGEVPVLKGASMKVTNGKIYGIFGLEQAGKSTLLSLMAGARDLQEGVVRINGFDLQTEPVSAKRCMGYCPQDAVFFPEMTVYELLDFVADAKAVQSRRRFIQIHEWMEEYGLKKLRNRRISKLTPFQIFRLKLVQALVGGGEILLLDEPTARLSPKHTKTAREMIRGLKEKGKTVFLATSCAEEILELADEVSLLRDGSLSAFAPVGEWLGGCTLLLRASGERATVLELLSGLDGLVSCQPMRRDEDGMTAFRIRVMGMDKADEIQNVMRSNEMEATVEQEPCDETEAALRSGVAADVAADVSDGCEMTGEGEEA